MQVLCLAAVVLVAACSSRDTIVRCPVIRVPAEASELTRFNPGEGRDVTDVSLQAEFRRISGECKVADERIDVDLQVDIVARRGPGGAGTRADFSYFIAITDLERNILQRRALPAAVAFPGNQRQAFHSEQFEIQIPKTAAQRGPDFIVFVGFELSEEELRFNRQERR